MGERSEVGGPIEAASVDAALVDLVRLRELMQSAARGDVRPEHVWNAALGCWRDHRQTFRGAWDLVIEAVRLEVLDELNRWRDQLQAQLRVIERQQKAASTNSRHIHDH